MSTALVACALGTAEIDLEDEDLVGLSDEPLEPAPMLTCIALPPGNRIAAPSSGNAPAISR